MVHSKRIRKDLCYQCHWLSKIYEEEHTVRCLLLSVISHKSKSYYLKEEDWHCRGHLHWNFCEDKQVVKRCFPEKIESHTILENLSARLRFRKALHRHNLDEEEKSVNSGENVESDYTEHDINRQVCASDTFGTVVCKTLTLTFIEKGMISRKCSGTRPASKYVRNM